MAKVHLISDPPDCSRSNKKKKTFFSRFSKVFQKIYKTLKIVSSLLVLLSVICVLFLMFTGDPRYIAEEIHIEGLKYYSDIEIKKDLAKFLKRKLGKIRDSEIKAELLKYPFIEDCLIKKIKEENKIIISVQEMPPYATLFVEDQLFLVSHTGKILKKIQSIKEAVGPLITGLFRYDVLEPGTYIDEEGFWFALEFWYEYNQVPKNKNIRISEIVITSSENIKVFFDEVPCETRWKRENLERQVQNFSIALNKVDITRIQCSEYIDMRFNDDIIYK